MLAKTLVVDLRPEVGDGRYLVYSLLLIVGVAAFFVFMAQGAGVFALPDKVIYRSPILMMKRSTIGSRDATAIGSRA